MSERFTQAQVEAHNAKVAKREYSKPTINEIHIKHSGPSSVPQSAIRNESLAEAQTKAGNCDRFFVRLTSVRKRLLDEDNLVGKFHTDLLRYAGIIPSDAPDKTSIRTAQRKCAEGEAEKVEIEVVHEQFTIES